MTKDAFKLVFDTIYKDKKSVAAFDGGGGNFIAAAVRDNKLKIGIGKQTHPKNLIDRYGERTHHIDEVEWLFSLSRISAEALAASINTLIQHIPLKVKGPETPQ